MTSCLLLPSLSGPEDCHRTVPHVLLLGPSMGKRWLQARSTLQHSPLLGRLFLLQFVNTYLFYKCLILSE